MDQSKNSIISNGMNPVVHFEMPAEDMSRMKTFYETAFGWKTKQLGPDMGDYVVVMTSPGDPHDPTGRPSQPGVINGGFYKRNNDPLSAHPSFVISVPDVMKAMDKVKEAGGTIIGGHKKDGTPDEIPGVGLFASVIDTEGNRVSLLQPKGM